MAKIGFKEYWDAVAAKVNTPYSIQPLAEQKHSAAATALGVDPTTHTFANMAAALGKGSWTDPVTGEVHRPTPFTDPNTGNVGGFLPPDTVPQQDPVTGAWVATPFGSVQSTTPGETTQASGLAGVPSGGKEPWEDMVARLGRERASPLLAAITGRLGAEQPGVERRAFSPYAERGFGLSGIAERGVGEALGVHAARGEQEKAKASSDALRDVMEEQLRILEMGEERYEAMRDK